MDPVCLSAALGRAIRGRGRLVWRRTNILTRKGWVGDLDTTEGSP